jgi:hypothetical protein
MDQRDKLRTVDLQSIRNVPGGDGTDTGADEHGASLSHSRASSGNQRLTLSFPSITTCTVNRDQLPVKRSSTRSRTRAT